MSTIINCDTCHFRELCLSAKSEALKRYDDERKSVILGIMPDRCPLWGVMNDAFSTLASNIDSDPELWKEVFR